jgi:hypothetical protein
VEHPGLATDLVRPWRTAAVVASAVAALELVVLLVLGVTLLAKPVATHVRKAAEARVFAPAKPPPKPRRQPIGAPKLSRGDTAVLVLNGNGRTGAAAVEAETVRAKGYRISSVADAPRRDYRRSLVMYRPGFAPEGRRLAKDLRIRVVGPLDGVGRRAMAGSHVVVVVGAR